jgi:hypothetical protein
MHQEMDMFVSAFPDMAAEVTLIVAEGGLVVGHQTTRVTH